MSNHNTSGLSGQTTQVNHMLDLQQRTQTLSALAGYFAFYGVGDNLLSGSGEPERLSGVPVSGNFFDVLGIRPALGRFFNADESRWNGPKAVVLGHGLWERRFNSDPRIVGTALTLNNEPHTVVGILPASFDFASVFAPGSRFDLYFPFPLAPETNRWGNTMAMVGRLKPGVPVGQAQAEMKRLGARAHESQSRPEQLRGLRQAAGRTGQRANPPGAVGARRVGRPRHVDRVCESLQSAPRADGVATEGDCDQSGAGRGAPAPHGPDADRRDGPVGRGRAGGRDPRRRGHPGALVPGCRQYSPAGRCSDGSRDAGLHGGRRDRNGRRLRACAGPPGRPQRGTAGAR